MKTWEDIFAPVMATGREVRTGQTTLGNAVINAIENKTSLLAEASTGTGKSFAVLIPIIDKVLESKKHHKTYRGVVSTETITLQTQLIEKDLPFLEKLYPGFTFSKLMGRSNYVCFNAAKLACKGNNHAYKLYEKLYKYRGNLGTGELADVERVLGMEVPQDLWGFFASSATFCADNQCDDVECFSTKARKAALTSDIVIVNHAVLSVHTEMIGGDVTGASEGMFGMPNVIVVDEGHQLEPVLVSQMTKTLSDWELHELGGAMLTGIDSAQAVYADYWIGDNAEKAVNNIQAVLSNIQWYYHRLVTYYGGEWKNSETALSEKNIAPTAPEELIAAMREFEELNPGRIEVALETLKKVDKFFIKAKDAQSEAKIKGISRKINKGHRSMRDLAEILTIIGQAIQSKDGIVNNYGAYGAIVDGWYRKNGDKGMTLRLVPLDVSKKASAIWETTQTSILLSATLTDLTDGSFNYARVCVAFPPGKELKVGTPFSLATQQLVYISPATQDIVDIPNAYGKAYFSFDELYKLLHATEGRALVLFTSRQELDWTAQQLKQQYAMGNFPYRVLVQEKDSNKAKLMEEFKKDTNSVLIATKSFFVGIDVPGESLSLVAICKYPLPRFSAECKQQIKHWGSRGFPRWYERESLTVFQQAAGRLIRSSGCKGVVALLDQRAREAGTTVCKTIKIGVDSLGSPFTLSIDEVESFLR